MYGFVETNDAPQVNVDFWNVAVTTDGELSHTVSTGRRGPSGAVQVVVAAPMMHLCRVFE
jgi:hypothetical protein